MTRASFPRAAAIFSLWFATLAVPLLKVQASSIAIISEPDDRSDAISKVIGALCESKRGADDEEGNYRGFCRHFQDASEVSSIISRNPEAFDAIVTEDRDHAVHVADFAARAGVPVARLAYRIEDIDPAFERPAVLVLEASPPEESQNYALKSIPYVMTEKVEELSKEALATLLLSTLGLSTDVSGALVSSSSSSSTALQPAFTCQRRNFRETMQNPCTVLSEDADSAPLGLTMIVKDEAGTIRETVRSAAPHIDYWTIMDTGSTDGTQDVVRGNLSTTPGQLVEKAFIDFATTRNDALKAHGARTAYTFMPDADFTFENMWRLRMIAWRLERECRFWSAHICGKSMRVVVQTNDMAVHMMQVVFPTSQHALGELEGWHYHYPVHEFSALGFDHSGEYITVPREKFHMRFMHGQVFHTKSEQRWRDFDIRILEAEKLKRPNDTRVAFYLARTYNQVGDNELALAEFHRRIDLGGWYEEVFHSLLQQGRILARMGRDPTPKFKKAFKLVPNRAEPLYELAAWEQRQVDACDGGEDDNDEGENHQKLEGLWLDACRFQHRALGYTYAKHAAALPYPQHSTLFISSHVYDRDAALQLVVHGYFLADLAAEVFRQGKVANDALASRFPGQEPHASNIEWYEKLKQKIERELVVAGATGRVSE